MLNPILLPSLFLYGYQPHEHFITHPLLANLGLRLFPGLPKVQHSFHLQPPNVPWNLNISMNKILRCYQRCGCIIILIILKPKSQLSRRNIKTEKDEHHLVEGHTTVSFKFSLCCNTGLLLFCCFVFVSASFTISLKWDKQVKRNTQGF